MIILIITRELNSGKAVSGLKDIPQSCGIPNDLCF